MPNALTSFRKSIACHVIVAAHTSANKVKGFLDIALKEYTLVNNIGGTITDNNLSPKAHFIQVRNIIKGAGLLVIVH